MKKYKDRISMYHLPVDNRRLPTFCHTPLEIQGS